MYMKDLTKRKLPLLLAGLLAASLAGCGGRAVPTDSPEPSEPSAAASTADMKPEEGAKLLFWTQDMQFGKAAGQAFEQKYGVPVDVQEAGLDGINKMMLDGPNGNGADLFMVANDSFQTGMGAGLYLQVDDQIAKVLNSEQNANAMKNVTQGGKVYGFPLSIETNALIYNKKWIKGKPAATFEEIAQQAGAFNDPAKNKYYFVNSPLNGYTSFPFLSAYGYQLFGAEGTDENNPGFDTPAFKQGLEAIRDLKKIVPLKSGDLTLEASNLLTQNFIDGNIAYYPNTQWVVKSLRDAHVDFGVTTLPTYQGRKMTPFASVQNVHVSAYSKYPHAAQLFAQFLVSQEGAELLYKEANKITARTDYASVPGLKDDRDLLVFADQFKEAVPLPGARRMSYYWTVMDGVLGAVFDGTMTPEEGASKAQADFEALVKSE